MQGGAASAEIRNLPRGMDAGGEVSGLVSGSASTDTAAAASTVGIPSADTDTDANAGAEADEDTDTAARDPDGFLYF